MGASLAPPTPSSAHLGRVKEGVPQRRQHLVKDRGRVRGDTSSLGVESPSILSPLLPQLGGVGGRGGAHKLPGSSIKALSASHQGLCSHLFRTKVTMCHLFRGAGIPLQERGPGLALERN